MRKLLPGIELKETFCEDCALSKAKKIPHHGKSKEDMAQEKHLKLKKGEIHSDLMGPVRNTAHNGPKYVYSSNLKLLMKTSFSIS